MEALGIPLPHPDQRSGKNNNRKQTFDAMCREMLFEICEKHGIHLDRESVYGGRQNLEKQDYIILKQNERIAQQEQTIAAQQQALNVLKSELSDVEGTAEKVAEVAYQKAVEVVTDTVREETQKADLETVADVPKWVLAPERGYSRKEKDMIGRVLETVQTAMKKAAKRMLAAI